MATQIKRVRFFDGQFLKQIDFRDEQSYHLDARRRMNFFLFGQSGVLPLGSGSDPDDLKFFDFNNVNKTFRVHAGMAICRSTANMEGKEIVLIEDSPPIDLDSKGIVAGGTAFVTLRFEEEEAKDPPSEGDVDQNTRFREKAVLEVHTTLPSGFAPNGEEYILLGAITYDDMSAHYEQRQVAQLRAFLIPGPAVPAPAITKISVHIANPGASIDATITGKNLSSASAVTFSGSGITTTINPGGTDSSLPVSIDVQSNAAVGTRIFTVTTPGGTANSSGVVGADFTIQQASLSLTSFSGVNEPNGDQKLKINGAGFSTPVLVEFSKTGGGFTAPPIPLSPADVTSTQISIPMSQIPADAISGPVRVQSSGQTMTSGFNVVPPATITDVAPTSFIQNTLVTILGSRFFTGTTVSFGAITPAASRGPDSSPPFPISGAEKLNPDRIEVLVPAGAVKGQIKIFITNGPATANGGTIQSSTLTSS